MGNVDFFFLCLASASWVISSLYARFTCLKRFLQIEKWLASLFSPEEPTGTTSYKREGRDFCPLKIHWKTLLNSAPPFSFSLLMPVRSTILAAIKSPCLKFSRIQPATLKSNGIPYLNWTMTKETLDSAPNIGKTINQVTEKPGHAQHKGPRTWTHQPPSSHLYPSYPPRCLSSTVTKGGFVYLGCD